MMKNEIKEIMQVNEELEELIEMSYEDIEAEPPTPLDKEIVEKYELIWKNVLKICQNEKITHIEEFDDKYPIFDLGLQDFVESYSQHLDYCTQMNKMFLDLETKMLEELMEQFELEENDRYEYELLLIRDTYIVGKKKEAKTMLDALIKKYPSSQECYEILCDWELEEKEPNIEKVAEIIKQAHDNNTFVPNENIYNIVIEYFVNKGNDEMAEYYSQMKDYMEEQYEGVYDEDFWDDDMFFEEDPFEELQEFFESEKQEVINELKQVANDKVEKNKKFEQYVQDKTDIALIAFLGPQAITKTPEEMIEIQKDIRKHILENIEEIIKENMVYMPKYVIDIIEEAPITGIIEMNLEKCTMDEVLKLQDYFLLKSFGMAFVGCKKTKVQISIPHIKLMKQTIKDKEIIKRNKEFNEKLDVIAGIGQAYGAIKVSNVYDIIKQIYGEIEQEQFARFLLVACEIFGKAQIKMNKKNSRLEYIYHSYIDEKTAKDIIKQNKLTKMYLKEEYLKYGDDDFYINLKGCKKLRKLFESEEIPETEINGLISDVIIPYTIEKRLGKKKAEEMPEMLVEQFKQSKEIFGENVDREINIIKESYKEIAKELPKWR